MTTIVGVNGVGKSTLMRVLAGIRPAAVGRVLLDGKDLGGMPARQRARLLAFVAQEETPPDELTLAEMVALGRLPHLMPWQVGGARQRRIVAESLAMVGLAELSERRCNQLSGGERLRSKGHNYAGEKDSRCCLPEKGCRNLRVPIRLFQTNLKSAYLYPWPLYFRLRICICCLSVRKRKRPPTR